MAECFDKLKDCPSDLLHVSGCAGVLQVMSLTETGQKSTDNRGHAY